MLFFFFFSIRRGGSVYYYLSLSSGVHDIVILSRFDARVEEESCGFFRLREFIQRERRGGGLLWLEWHVVVEGW